MFAFIVGEQVGKKLASVDDPAGPIDAKETELDN